MEMSATVPPSGISPRQARTMLTRYEEAYSLTESVESLAKALRWGAKLVLIGAAIVMIGLGLNGEGWGSTFPMIAGAALSLILSTNAILVAAAGQFLTATLDTAVNTSPFLDHEQRAKVMQL